MVSNIILLFKGQNINQPKSLKPETKSNYSNLKFNVMDILIISIVIGVFLIGTAIVFKYGALESTQVYNRGWT